ncbi:MAG: hypothetical protein KAG18_00025 [Sinobacterium sp.]|nr:hypothetical protein [Sinobacterium sp.]
MPSRDDSIDLDQLQSLQADSKDAPDSSAADAPPESVKVEKTPKPFSQPPLHQEPTTVKALWFVVLILLLLLFGVSYLVIDGKKSASVDHDRINALEARLSDTDESMSQSSVAMQVKLNEVKSKTDQLWGQMDKLWASAWRRNQTDIVEHASQIKANGKKVDDTQALIKELEKVNIQIKKEMIALQREAKKFRKLKAAVEKKLTAQKQSISTTVKQVNDVQQSLQAVDKRSNDNARWIESINAFRKETNKTLSEFERQLQTSPATATTQP